jgi:hypothetical protein
MGEVYLSGGPGMREKNELRLFHLFIQPAHNEVDEEYLNDPEGQGQQGKDMERMPWNYLQGQQNYIRDVNDLGR